MIVNAGYFNMTTNFSVSLITSEGEVLATNPFSVIAADGHEKLAYYPTTAAFGIYSNFSAGVTWVYNIDSNNSDAYSYRQHAPNCYGCLLEASAKCEFSE